MPRSLLLLLLLPLTACPPTRSGGLGDDDDATADDDDSQGDDDDDDDDATTGDDDDLTPDPPPPTDDDDDDDTPWPDDDDDISTDSCALEPDSSLWFDASAGDVDGTWWEGELAWDGSSVSITTEDGTEISVNVYGSGIDADALLGFASGPGRMMVAATSWGAWTANGVLAVQSDWSLDVAVLGTNSPSVTAVGELGFDLYVNPNLGACTQPLFDVDGCGLGAAVPLEVELQGPWTAELMETWPGDWQWIGDGQFQQYSGWQVFELLCDDFDSPGYSWSYRAYGDVDG